VRIVSLLPSATEIVCALGAADELVGRSHECDFPVTIVDRPALTSARIAAGASSLEIDRAVRDVIEQALSIYAIDDELLAELEPDVIVTQDLCEVCAVSLDDVRSAVARLAGDHVRIVSLSPTRLEHVMQNVEDVARAIDRVETGRRVRASLEQRIRDLAARAALAPARPRVATLEWLDPLMVGGTWMPELVELAGGIALDATAGAPARTITRARLTELAPDVVILKPCGFTIERTLEEAELVAALGALVPAARVYIADGNAYFNRPGPRLVESLEVLAACVHPELFATPAPDDAVAVKSR